MAVTTNQNPLQPTSFMFVADRRRLANITFFAQSVMHPSLSTNAAEVPYSQYTSVPMTADKITYSALTVNMILDEDMKAYEEIIDWMKYFIVNNESVTSVSDDSHYADLTLNINTSKNNLVKSIRYEDAFPTDLGEIQMEANAESVPVIIVPVTFRFTSFTLAP